MQPARMCRLHDRKGEKLKEKMMRLKLVLSAYSAKRFLWSQL